MGTVTAQGTAHRRLVMAGIVGNVLEWYDFGVADGAIVGIMRAMRESDVDGHGIK